MHPAKIKKHWAINHDNSTKNTLRSLADIQTCTIDSMYPNLAIEKYSEKEEEGGGGKIFFLSVFFFF